MKFMILIALVGVLLFSGPVSSAPLDAGDAAEVVKDSAPGPLIGLDANSTTPEAENGAVVADAGNAMSPAERAEADPLGAADQMIEDVKSGNWRYAASGALLLLMVLLGRVRKHIKIFDGDRGGAILVGVMAMLGAFGTSLGSPAPMDWKLFLGALGVMWLAVGQYTWVKQLVWPRDERT